MRRTLAPFHPFLSWSICMGLLGFATFVAMKHGLLAQFLSTDTSYISVIIASGFLLASLHAGRRAWVVSSELSFAAQIDTKMTAASQVECDRDGRLHIDGQPQKDCWLTIHASRVAATSGHEPGSRDALYAALEREISGPQENGWLIADMMVRLGLLGTVVGFIVMLASMNGAQDFDIATLRNMMTEMSAGMRIALFTTLAGITSGLLLGIQYRIAERGADALLSAIAVATESKLLPAITRGASE